MLCQPSQIASVEELILTSVKELKDNKQKFETQNQSSQESTRFRYDQPKFNRTPFTKSNYTNMEKHAEVV